MEEGYATAKSEPFDGTKGRQHLPVDVDLPLIDHHCDGLVPRNLTATASPSSTSTTRSKANACADDRSGQRHIEEEPAILVVDGEVAIAGVQRNRVAG